MTPQEMAISRKIEAKIKEITMQIGSPEGLKKLKNDREVAQKQLQSLKSNTEKEIDLIRLQQRSLEKKAAGGRFTPGTKENLYMEMQKEKRRLGEEDIIGKTLGVSPGIMQAGQMGMEAGRDFGKGVGKALTKEYSSEMKTMGNKAKRATFGIISALTETGGLFEDTPSNLVGVGRSGGLARIKQRSQQTKGRVGRPAGSYKYGAPVQQLKAMERETKRQAAIQKYMAQQRILQAQLQSQAQPQMQQMQAQQIPQDIPEETFNDNELQQGFAEPMRSGFITPEMINQQIPPQMMTQGPKDIYARTVPATSLQRGNPFSLKAKSRPNLSFNPLKYLGKNLMSGGKSLLTAVRPASTSPFPQRQPPQMRSQMPNGSLANEIQSEQNQMSRRPSFQFQNRDESGMLA
jgi:hypothetical protein